MRDWLGCIALYLLHRLVLLCTALQAAWKRCLTDTPQVIAAGHSAHPAPPACVALVLDHLPVDLEEQKRLELILAWQVRQLGLIRFHWQQLYHV